MWTCKEQLRKAEGRHRPSVFPHHKHIKRLHNSSAQQNEKQKELYSICSKGTDRHLTYTCDIVTVAKTFHSGRGNESVSTNA